MTLDVLISCMYQEDFSIVQKSHLSSGAVIVNQCDISSERTDTTTLVVDNQAYSISMISTPQRGLSRSRNMAIYHSKADICMLSDDDEIYADNYPDNIQQAFQDYPHADVILFNVENAHRAFPDHPMPVGYLRALRFCSLQIVFRRNSIIEKGVLFDEMMGSGTGNGSGEENKFLFDCLKQGLKLQYVPITIATVVSGSNSQWFSGYTDKFFFDKGWATSRYMGKLFATLYVTTYAIRKYSLYKKENTLFNSYKCMLKGVFSKK